MAPRPSTPAMPKPWKAARSFAGHLRRQYRDWRSGETAGTTFDLFNLRAFNGAVTPLGVTPWARGVTQANQSETGAMRFALTEYAARPELLLEFWVLRIIFVLRKSRGSQCPPSTAPTPSFR